MNVDKKTRRQSTFVLQGDFEVLQDDFGVLLRCCRVILKQLSCVQNVRGTMSVYLVAVGREGEEEHEEDEAGGGDEPQLQHGVGADEEDHGGEHELAPQVDGLPVVELVLVGVGEQRDA